MNVIINIAVPMLAFAGGMVFEYCNRSRELRHLQDLVSAQDELLDQVLPRLDEGNPVGPFTVEELAPGYWDNVKPQVVDGDVWPQLKLIRDEHAAQRAAEDQAMRLGNGDKADQW